MSGAAGPQVTANSLMRIKWKYKILGLGALALTAYLSGCATPTPPSTTSNACTIFEDHRAWYRHMKRAEKRWGMPVAVQLAIMKQESRFVHNARPPRRKVLWVLPGPRRSSAYGYAQAKTTTWEWYKSETGRKGADRNDFKDAADFIAWYGDKSRQLSKIDPTDSYNQYLAFHEGQGGYNRESYKSKEWLVNVARSVEANANRYDAQLEACADDLQSGFLFF